MVNNLKRNAEVIPLAPSSGMTMYWSNKFQTYVIRKKQTSQGADTPKRQQARQDFVDAVSAIKKLPGPIVEWAYDLAKNRPFLPRDIMMMGVYGTLFEFVDQNGTKWMGARVAQKEIETLLASISTLAGAILVRTSSAWEVLIPGTENQMLVMSASGEPDWVDPLANIPATEGDILYFDGASWVVLPVGSATEVLTVNSLGVPAWEPASGGGGGGGFIGYFGDPVGPGSLNLTSNAVEYQPFLVPAGFEVTGVAMTFRETYYGNSYSVALYADKGGTSNAPGALLAESASGFSGPTSTGYKAALFDTSYVTTSDEILWAAFYTQHQLLMSANARWASKYVTGQSMSWADPAPSTTDGTTGIALALTAIAA